MKKPQIKNKFTRKDNWFSVQIDCKPGFEDIISTFIFESGFSGLEEHNKSGRVIFTAFYPDLSIRPTPLENLNKAFNNLTGQISRRPGRILSVKALPRKDWETEWRTGLGAVEVGSCLVVRPSWVNYRNIDNRIEIIIDPKMAFGTGSHATTYLCLETLERINLNGLSVLDAGCGSGILSIAAAKLGAQRVCGFDNDTFSVKNALENIRINSVNDKVIIEEAELKTVKAEPCDLVLANMMSSLLIPNLPIFRSFLRPHGTVIFSGLLAEEETLFAESLKKERFRIFKVTRRDEWIAVHAGV